MPQSLIQDSEVQKGLRISGGRGEGIVFCFSFFDFCNLLDKQNLAGLLLVTKPDLGFWEAATGSCPELPGHYDLFMYHTVFTGSEKKID